MIGKFYTPDSVANLMVSRIPVTKPRYIVDICAGSGNLLWAARRKWPKAIIYAVDKDPLTVNHFSPDGSIRFAIGDGHLEVLKKHLYGRCDVVLANPPFIKTNKPPPKRFDDIIQLINEIRERVCKRLEASMLIANLIALAPDGYLALILPNGLLNGAAWEPLRKLLVQKYRVLEIIDLPKVFKNTGVKSSVVIIRNQSPERDSKSIMSAACLKNGQIFVYKREKVSSELLVRRMDANYVIMNKHNKSMGNVCLQELPVVLRRGLYSSGDSKSKTGIRIVHSTSISSSGQIGYDNLYVSKKDLKKGIIGETKVGDIVFVRVGKTLGRTGIIGEKEKGAIISDCIFRIRLTNGYSPKMLFDYVRSDDAKKYFKKVSRGTAASYVTKADLLSLPIPPYVAKHYL